MRNFSGKRYFNYILWAQAYNNNTLLSAAIRYKKTGSTAINRKKKVSNYFVNCPYPI